MGNYSRAAEQLDVTEPCVYRAVQSLQRALGVELLYKEKGKIRPTFAGRILQEYAEKIDGLEAAAEESIGELVNKEGGILVFGVSRPFAGILAKYLTPWKEKRPELQLGIVAALRNELYVRTLLGELLFAFAPLIKLPLGLTAEDAIFNDEMVLVANSGHPLAGRRSVSLAEIATEPFIASFPSTVTYGLLMEIGEKTGVRPKIAVQVDHADTIVDFVVAGAGIGVVSKYLVAEPIRQGKVSVINIPEFPRMIPYGFIFRSGVTPSRQVHSLVGYLASVLPKRDADARRSR